MKMESSVQENYTLVTLKNDDNNNDLPSAVSLQEFLKANTVNKNPCILQFKKNTEDVQAFMAWLEDAKTAFQNSKLSWVLIPPFKGHYEELENAGIDFAPTFSEAEDMAFMIKIEQEL